jgi:hypothetical protein
LKEVKLISSAHKYIQRGKTDILSTVLLLTVICVLRIFDLLLSVICVLMISVLPLSMYLCVEDIGFTSFCDLFVENIGLRGKTDTLYTQIYRKR